MKMGPKQSRAAGTFRVGMALVLVGCSFAPTAVAQDNRYFLGTKSDANVYVAPVPSSITKVAVLPFKASTDLMGSSISDIFVTELLRARRYTLVERGQIDRVLGETEFALSGLSESAAIEAGRMMGADGVILGTVDEYGTVAYRGRTYPVVGASIRLIDCDTGRVMWSVGHSRRALSPADTLSGHARNVVHEMVAAVVQNWRVQRVVAKPGSPAYEERQALNRPMGLQPTPAAPAAPAAQTAPPPSSPDKFSVSDFGLREVTLAWTPSADRWLQYRVERAESPEGPFVAIATVAASQGNHKDAGAHGAPLKDASTYYYRLTAIDAMQQESEPSAVMESMTAPPPAAPNAIEVSTPAGRAVQLAWKAPSSEGIVRYQIERAKDPAGAFAKIGEVTQPTFSEGGTSASPLEDATDYWYRIRAINRVGSQGDYSEPVKATTLPPPDPPKNLSAVSLEVRCVPLTWDAHPAPDIVRYDIYRSDNKEGPFARVGSVTGREKTSWLDGGRDPGNLQDDRAYSYCIRAINSVTSESADSDVAEAVTRPPPPRVEDLATVTGLPRKVELTWTPSTDEKVTAYEIERAEADGSFGSIGRIEGRESAAHTDTGNTESRFMRSNVHTPLKDGTTYSYRIRAINTAGATSDWSEPASAATKVVPEAPTGLQASKGKARIIELTWDANKEKDIAAYVVETSMTADRGFSEVRRIPAGEERTLKQEGLSPNLTRYYRIKAVDADGLVGGWSDVVAGSTKPLPDAPKELAVEWKDDGALLRWTPPPQTDVVRYRLLNKRLMGHDNLGESDTEEHFFPADALAKKLVVMIVAVDEDGLESPFSTPLEVRKPK